MILVIGDIGKGLDDEQIEQPGKPVSAGESLDAVQTLPLNANLLDELNAFNDQREQVIRDEGIEFRNRTLEEAEAQVMMQREALRAQAENVIAKQPAGWI